MSVASSALIVQLWEQNPMTGDDPTNTVWEMRMLDRSLDDARRRALIKSRRFLEAAGQLMSETGATSFTVQDVVERSQMSLGSFYRVFAGKDELLLAMFEESVALGAVMQQNLIADISDPLEQVRALVIWIATSRVLAEQEDEPAVRALTNLHLTLVSTRPADLARALEPQLRVLIDSVELGVANGQIRGDLPSRRLAEMTLTLAIDAAHRSILHDGPSDASGAADDLWSFCLEGLLRRDTYAASTTQSDAASVSV